MAKEQQSPLACLCSCLLEECHGQASSQPCLYPWRALLGNLLPGLAGLVMAFFIPFQR